MGAHADAVRVLPFSDEWMEGFLDLAVQDDARDPLAGPPSRDVSRSRLELHRSMGITKAHVVAVEGGRVVGSAKVNLVATCGEEGKAYLSLMVAPSHRRRGIGTRLVERVCAEMASLGVEWVQLGTLDEWEGWRRFLETRGFEPHGIRSADVSLLPVVAVPEPPPTTGAVVRPVRLPQDRGRWIEFANRERAEDLPGACAVPPAGPTPWEVDPEARGFDPSGFLIAEERGTGELVGSVRAHVEAGDRARGVIDDLEVAKRLLRTPLKESLLVQAVTWLRKRGAASIEGRLHIGYRDDEELFRRAGFTVKNTATTWRRRTRAP